MADTISDLAQVSSPILESILSLLLCKHDRSKGLKNKTKNQDIFFSQKKKDNMDLVIKFENDRVITTPEVFFQESNQKKISDLVSFDMFKFELFNKNNHNRIWLFKSYIVCKIKIKNNKPYEKSQLVIQGYYNNDKEFILT